jgi:hypothetical protein
VGSENGHRIRQATPVRLDAVAPSPSDAHLSERAAAFPRRLCATPSVRSERLGRRRSRYFFMRVAALSTVEPVVGRGASGFRCKSASPASAGALVTPPDGSDTIIGPIAFKDLPASYRYSSRHPDVGMKSVALLRARARVGLVVPRAQRRWLNLRYSGERLHRRRSTVHALTCRAVGASNPSSRSSGNVGGAPGMHAP